MKIGLIARMDNSGLGVQTHEFYRHMNPAKTLVIDMSEYNHNQNFPERYPKRARFCLGMPSVSVINEFLNGLDVVFVAEAPYNYYLYERARELGVKTAVQYNYEFFDWFLYPHYSKPDMLIAPSKWFYQDVERWARANDVMHVHLHCPVDVDKLRAEQHYTFETFLHIAGRAAAHDRNGTLAVIAAAPHLKTDARIIIHFQGQQGIGHQVTHSIDEYLVAIAQSNQRGNIIVRHQEYNDYQDIYSEGDVMILPRRYGGNCLPMNEALATGMPVLMPNISPNSSFLPPEWLTPAYQQGSFSPRTTIPIYDTVPQMLAARIDKFYNMSVETVYEHQAKALKLAQSISWQTLKPQYEATLEALCMNR